ncbi:MAG: biopolymer transporter ExbD [Candidatus Latescibacteria bacterium]|nr:biopolymer transporter ExbD [Candidatus Latescibacterota bacterium]
MKGILVFMAAILLMSFYIVSCGPKPPKVEPMPPSKTELPEQYLNLTVDENGEMELNHKPVTFANLKKVMAKERARLNDTTMIIIHADEKAFDQVVKVMDMAKQIGVIDLVVATEKPSQGK